MVPTFLLLQLHQNPQQGDETAAQQQGLLCQPLGDASTLQFRMQCRNALYLMDVLIHRGSQSSPQQPLELLTIGEVCNKLTTSGETQVFWTLELLKTESPIEEASFTPRCNALLSIARSRLIILYYNEYLVHLPWDGTSLTSSRKEFSDRSVGNCTVNTFNSVGRGDIVLVTFYNQAYVHIESQRQGIRLVWGLVLKMGTSQ